MPAARYSEEFKAQVVREVIEKERTISSVASSYDLVPQTVGNWVARYRKEHATDQDWTARCFSDTAYLGFQAALVRPRNSCSTSLGVRYPRAE